MPTVTKLASSDDSDEETVVKKTKLNDDDDLLNPEDMRSKNDESQRTKSDGKTREFERNRNRTAETEYDRGKDRARDKVDRQNERRGDDRRRGNDHDSGWNDRKRNFDGRRDDRRRENDEQWRNEYGSRRNYDRRDGAERNDRPRNWRRDDRQRDRGGDRQRERDDAPTDGPAWATSRVKQHAEKMKERKLLWNKKSEDVTESGEGTSIEASEDQQATRNMGMWSSAIAATGVDSAQAEKFKKLLGFKGGATQEIKTDEASLDQERAKQRKLMSTLDKQFTAAREATHMGKGMGFGFH